jgi:mRNA interferase RelE/StbE
MSEDLQGDVKKLKDQANRYRLRVGSYRIMFALAGETIQIYAVRDRKEAYE